MDSARNISTLFITFVIFVFSLACNNQEKASKKPENYKGKPEIAFNDTIYDLGELKEGEIAEYSFKFKNTGTAPLKIKNIVTDCGCTVPEYDKKPVLPGREAKIKVSFDSQGFRNNIYKTITVETNANSKKYILVLTAYIKNNNTLNY
jgi:hypothetical protein